MNKNPRNDGEKYDLQINFCDLFLLTSSLLYKGPKRKDYRTHVSLKTREETLKIGMIKISLIKFFFKKKKKLNHQILNSTWSTLETNYFIAFTSMPCVPGLS